MTRLEFDVERYLDEQIGILARSSGKHVELTCTCPYCGRSKLYVNSVTGRWLCFVCEEKGSFGWLMAKIEGISFFDACARLGEGSTASCKPLPAPGEDEQRDAESLSSMEYLARYLPLGKKREPFVPPALPEDYLPVYDPVRHAVNVPAYLQERRVSVATAATYHLGFSREGRYGMRLIFPVHHEGYKTFTGRLVVRGEPRYYGPPDDRKSDWLFGFDQAAFARRLVVVEGPVDCVRMHQHGYKAVALMTKRASVAQRRAIVRKLCPAEIVVMLDGEAVVEGHKLAHELRSPDTRLPRPVVAMLPDGMDPGEAPEAVIAAAIAAARPPHPMALYLSPERSRDRELVRKS